MIRPIDLYRLVMYLRRRHPKGATRGEIRAYVLTGPSPTGAEVQGMLERLVEDGLAVVEWGRSASRWYSPPPTRAYVATTKLITMPEPSRPARLRRPETARDG